MWIPWLVIVLSLVIAVVGIFAPAPEAGKRFDLKWRILVAILGTLIAALSWKQLKDDTAEKKHFTEVIENLKKVSPLRKQASELAKELLDFYELREHYNDRFKP